MKFNRDHIISEIKRIANANGGKAPGRQVFERETGIRESDWYPDIWLRWSEALAEAGHAPNQLMGRIDDEVVIQGYIGLVRELGRFPVLGEVRRKAKADKSFPSHTVFDRFGGKEKLIESVVGYCRGNAGFSDVLALYDARETSSPNVGQARGRKLQVATGFVYLMKSGRHYKIGRTKSVGRRESELSIKIPVPPKTIHTIETDDPVGVEAYWHRRFNDKRGEGEWFELTANDVQAFRRWKRIV